MLTKLYDRDEISKALACMAQKIEMLTYDLYKSKLNTKKFTPFPVTFVMVLKGGPSVGFGLLQRSSSYISEDCRIGFIGVSSYGVNTYQSKDVKITYPLDLKAEDLVDRAVWIVDDIVETGFTFNCVKTKIYIATGKEAFTCALVNKGSQIRADVHGIHYYGNEFLVGCGMGKGEEYRSLDSIYSYKE